MATEQKEETKSVEFLISEFNALQQRVVLFEQVKANRINYFMILASAFVAGMSALYDNLGAKEFSYVLAGSGFILSMVGLITLDYSLNDSITIVHFLRAAGRIRRYFVDHDKNLLAYLVFEPNDDRPKIRADGVSFRGSERILLVINCMSTSMFAAAMAYQFFPFVASIPIAVLIFPFVWVTQQLYIKRKLERAQNRLSTYVRYATEQQVDGQ